MTKEDFAKFADFEIDGRNIGVMLDAFRVFPTIPRRAFARHGIGTVGSDGKVSIDRDAWYPMDTWLAIQFDLRRSVGPAKALDMGSRVPEYATFPPGLDSLTDALATLDVAFHLNHRHKGRIMFDRATGESMDGIGHYMCTMDPSGVQAIIDCDNPYPCEFDRGILFGLGKRFGQRVGVEHDEESRCRLRGADRCRYVVCW